MSEPTIPIDPATPGPLFVSLEEAALILDRSVKAIRNRVYASPGGLPPSTKVMGRICFARSVWDSWWAEKHGAETTDTERLARLRELLPECAESDDWQPIIDELTNG